MEPVLHGVHALQSPLAGSVVTLGAFDGVHRGHQTLIRVAADAAQQRQVPALGFTFHPHPAKVLAPHRAPPLLMALQERTQTMLSYGLDAVVVQPFDAAFAQVSADAFVADYLVAPLRPQLVVVGFNFAYGKGRAGNLEHLRSCAQRWGFDVHVVEPVQQGEIVCSSTAIRRHLEAGDIDAVAELMGRPHTLTGLVEKGDQRGRTLGFPTANVASEAELLPKVGVYATRVQIEGEQQWRPSVSNIGRRPTFDGTHVTVEVHLLDFEQDLYGKRLRVQLVQRLRDEQRFDGLPAIQAQLTRDVASARARLAS